MLDPEGIAIWIPQELFQEPIPPLIRIQMYKKIIKMYIYKYCNAFLQNITLKTH